MQDENQQQDQGGQEQEVAAEQEQSEAAEVQAPAQNPEEDGPAAPSNQEAPAERKLEMVEVKLTQEWGEHKEGDVVSLDSYNAGQLIEAGKAVAVEQE